MSNKSVGNRFETIVALKLADAGFWVHNMQQNKAGQPADLIAVGRTNTYLIDVKHCEHNSWKKDRIEPNQHTVAKIWKARTEKEMYFCLVYQMNYYMVSYPQLVELGSFKDLSQLPTLKEWLDGNSSK